MSAQKALQGSETKSRELLGGTIKKSILQMGVNIGLLGKSMIFVTKNKQTENKLSYEPDLENSEVKPVWKDVVLWNL